jgi:hypothetical protein
MSLGFGLGIGMQGQLKDYTSLYADAYKQKAALAATKAAKKEASDNAQMSKLLKSVWVDGSKYHRTLSDDAANTYTEVSEKLSELQAEHPNDWVARAQPLLGQASSKLGKLRERTEQYRRIEAMPNVADPAQKEIQERLGWANDWRSVVSMKDNTGSVITTPEGDISFKKQYYDQKSDPRDYAAKMLKDKSYELNQFANEKTGGKFTTIQTGSTIARDRAGAEEVAKKLNAQFPTLGITADQIPTVENIAGQVYANPETKKAMDYFYQDKYYDYKGNAEKMTADERVADMESSFMEDVNQRIGGSFKTTVVKNPVGKSAGAGSIAYDKAIKTPLSEATLIMNWSNAAGDVMNYPAKSAGAFGVSVTYNIPATTRAIRIDNGQPFEAGAEFKTATIAVVPVLKQDYGSFKAGVPIATADNKNTIAGAAAMSTKDFAALPKDKYEYEIVVIGKAYTSSSSNGVQVSVPNVDMQESSILDKITGAEEKGRFKGELEQARLLKAKKNAELGGKKIEGTKAQLEAAAKKKGLTYDAYKTQLENAGYTVIVK